MFEKHTLILLNIDTSTTFPRISFSFSSQFAPFKAGKRTRSLIKYHKKPFFYDPQNLPWVRIYVCHQSCNLVFGFFHITADKEGEGNFWGYGHNRNRK